MLATPFLHDLVSFRSSNSRQQARLRFDSEEVYCSLVPVVEVLNVSHDELVTLPVDTRKFSLVIKH